MADQRNSRFAPQNQTTHQRLSTHTVGLVALSDFRKRRAEVLEQQEREAREAALAGTSQTDRTQTGTPDNIGSDSAASAGISGSVKKKQKQKQKKKDKAGKKLLSFGGEDDDDDDNERDGGGDTAKSKGKGDDKGTAASDTAAEKPRPTDDTKSKFKANANVAVIPKAMTKSALRKEAAERESLRREFVAVQEAVKATEIAIPFVFYDGANTPGGMVRMKKGDFVWVFLDKSRKVGAELGVGEHANALRSWARVGVDDLMLVRGTVIIPHHYDFYYFIINKSIGPGQKRLFNYSDNAPSLTSDSNPVSATGVLITSETKAAAAKALPHVGTLEGATDDPTLTKVVDRRWYERHKHIYPASTWQEFDAEEDYASQIRKDTGGNTFFFSK